MRKKIYSVTDPKTVGARNVASITAMMVFSGASINTVDACWIPTFPGVRLLVHYRSASWWSNWSFVANKDSMESVICGQFGVYA